MAELFYKEERDYAFFHICEKIRTENKAYISIVDIAAKAISMPTDSFFIHPKAYSKIIRGQGGNLPQNPIRKELYLEILERYKQIKAEQPELKTSEIARIIEDQPAPKFYMSVKRATNLYYQLLKKHPKAI